MRYGPWFLVSVVLAALGAIFYLYMGLAHGGWLDRGVYSVAVTFLAFGLVGMWVARLEAREA